LPQTATLGTMMSLKERRATQVGNFLFLFLCQQSIVLRTQDDFCLQAPGLGKRFLPIDDEEDDEDIPFDSP
jgi:hypothetical protein